MVLLPASIGKSVSALEDLMALQIRADRLPEPQREAVLIPGRKFRVDFFWPTEKVCLEVNGGVWMKGGAHSLPSNIERDYEKLNLLQLAGYVVLSVSGKAVKSGQALQWLKMALSK